MERGGASPVPVPAASYSLKPCRLMSEDILFCVDVDVESRSEMKVIGPKGRPMTRMDAIKQALLLFVNAKLTINPDHRFAFASLAQSFSWIRREFSNEVESAVAAVGEVRALDLAHDLADLTQLFRIASHEAKKSKAQGRLLRVIYLLKEEEAGLGLRRIKDINIAAFIKLG